MQTFVPVSRFAFKGWYQDLLSGVGFGVPASASPSVLFLHPALPLSRHLLCGAAIMSGAEGEEAGSSSHGGRGKGSKRTGAASKRELEQQERTTLRTQLSLLKGGLSCAAHGWVLPDAQQETSKRRKTPVPTTVAQETLELLQKLTNVVSTSIPAPPLSCEGCRAALCGVGIPMTI